MMASHTIDIVVGFMLLLSQIHLLPNTQALPLPGGSGIEPQTGIDCTVATVSTTTHLGALQAGFRALEDYARSKRDSIRDSTYRPSCPLASLYGVEKDKTNHGGLGYTSNQTGSGQPIADWYSVLVTFEAYMESLEGLALVNSADNSTLQTLMHITASVKEEFLNVLQSLHCNCSDSTCNIINKDLSSFPNLHNCQDPFYSVLKRVPIMIKYANRAVKLMLNNDCCSAAPSVDVSQWIAENIPSSSPDYSALQSICFTC